MGTFLIKVGKDKIKLKSDNKLNITKNNNKINSKQTSPLKDSMRSMSSDNDKNNINDKH